MATAWWLPVFPGLAICLSALSINWIGDFLRKVIDPRLRTEARLDKTLEPPRRQGRQA